MEQDIYYNATCTAASAACMHSRGNTTHVHDFVQSIHSYSGQFGGQLETKQARMQHCCDAIGFGPNACPQYMVSRVEGNLVGHSPFRETVVELN